MVILITCKQQPLENIRVDTRNTCSNLNDGDNCGCLVVPKATIGPVWNNMWSAGTRRYHFLGLLKLQLLHTYTHGGKKPNEANLYWYDLPWVIYVSSASSSVSWLPLLQPDWAYYKNTEEVKQSCTGLMCEKNDLFCLISLS